MTLSLLPYTWLVLLIHWITGQIISPGAAGTTASLITTPGAVRKSLEMAQDEFRTIRDVPPQTIEAVMNFTHPALSGQKRKPGVVRTYWAKGNQDHWAPEWIRTHTEEVLKLLPVQAPAFTEQVMSRIDGVPDHESEAIIEALTHEHERFEHTERYDAPGSDANKMGTTAPVEDKGVPLPTRTTSVCEVGMPHAFCLECEYLMLSVVLFTLGLLIKSNLQMIRISWQQVRTN